MRGKLEHDAMLITLLSSQNGTHWTKSTRGENIHSITFNGSILVQ